MSKVTRPISFDFIGDDGEAEGFEGNIVAADTAPVRCAVCDRKVSEYVEGPDVYAPGMPEYFCLADFLASSEFANIKIGEQDI